MEDAVSYMEVKNSVRNLVEFLLRNGDIDNRRGGRSAQGAMAEGSKIHRMIQKIGGASYCAEVPLDFLYPFDAGKPCVFHLEGRADGIFEDASGFVIDEIKGTYRDVAKKKEPELLHVAQAKCYGFMYAAKEGLEDIGIQITYCNIETMEIKRFYERISFEEIKDWFESLMQQYTKWLIYEIQWKQIRTASLKEIVFPFEYRTGQKELAVHVYHTICHEKKLFIEAPTGVGKTITTIFPVLKAIGEGKADRFFYFTAKTITAQVAENTISLLRQNQEMKLKSVILTAKEKICPMEEMDCNPEHCPYAKGHYDRINEGLYEMLISNDSFTRETILKYADLFCVCPFELSLDVSLFCDAVIGDYNYLFDPHVYLKRFFQEGERNPYLFLVDEAHNLVERGRNMYSATIIKEDVLALKREINAELVKESASGIPISIGHRLVKKLESVNKELLALKRQCNHPYEVILPEQLSSFEMRLNSLIQLMDEYLEKEEKGGEIRKKILDYYFELSHFCLIWDNLDEHYRIYTRMGEEAEFLLTLYCIDPSVFLRECMNKGVASILFSATFLPIQYYKRLLGGLETDYEVYAHSVFEEKKKGLFISTDTTTKYSQRTEEQYERIADYINRIVHCKSGNYMVFFPSYQFARRVYEKFSAKYQREEVECILQNEGMREVDREQFLSSFCGNHQNLSEVLIRKKDVEIDKAKTLIGFCIMGGIFSEGIDLRGDSLIGAIIVGTGLLQVCPEREILRDYFDENANCGFDYAYRYPGMNKVLQSSGRVIRTADDIGIVVLLDYRFREYSYQKLFPREWRHQEIVNINNVEEKISCFWKQRENETK